MYIMMVMMMLISIKITMELPRSQDHHNFHIFKKNSTVETAKKTAQWITEPSAAGS